MLPFGSSLLMVVRIIAFSLLIILILSWIVFMFFDRPGYCQKYLVRISFFIGYCLSSVLYYPLLGIQWSAWIGATLLGMKCQQQGDSWVSCDYPSIPCFTGLHLAAFATGVILVPLLFIFALSFKMFIFNHNINFADPASALTSATRIKFHVSRTVLLCSTVAGSLV
jgi:hypothetical protein